MLANRLLLNPACLIKWCFSICHTCLCGVSLSDMSAVGCLALGHAKLVCCLIISPRARNRFNQVVEDKRFEGVFLCRKVC